MMSRECYIFSEIDECENVTCTHGVCRDVIGDFDCICDAGFIGEYCETSKCVWRISHINIYSCDWSSNLKCPDDVSRLGAISIRIHMSWIRLVMMFIKVIATMPVIISGTMLCTPTAPCYM